MTSEIRVNKHTNRVGLGTIEYSNTGPVISGVTTASNFKTGSSNLHSSGVEVAGINVLGADTPIGLGATIYNSGAAVFTGVTTASQGLRVPNGSATSNYISVGNNGTLRIWGTGHQFADIRAGNLHFRNGSLDNVLEIQQDKDIWMYGPLYAQDTARFAGTVTIFDTITHQGDTDTKIRFPAADQIQLDTGGTNYLKLHRYASVNFVEVGASAALSLADNGSNSRNIMIGDGDASSTGQLFLQAGGRSTGYGGAITMYSHSNGTNPGGVYIGKSLNSSGSIIFGNGGTSATNEYLRIQSGGNVMIGGNYTSTNLGKLYVDGVIGIDDQDSGTSTLNIMTANNNRLKIQATSSISEILTQNNVPFVIKTDAGTGSGIERLRIDSSGNVTVKSSANNQQPKLRVESYGEYGEIKADGNGSIIIDADPDFNSSNSYIGFSVDGSIMSTIDSNGNFNLGLTGSPAQSTTEQGVFLAGADSTQSVISSNVTPFAINRMGTGGNDRNCIEFRNNGSLKGTIGAVGVNNGIFFQSGVTEVMRITSDYKVIVGMTTTGTSTSNNNLELAGTKMLKVGHMYMGYVIGTGNNGSGVLILHKMGQNVGLQFSGMLTIHSYTGSAYLSGCIVVRYNTDVVTRELTLQKAASGANFELVSGTISGESGTYFGIKKNGGGTGSFYINALVAGNIESYGGIREVSDGNWTTSTTHFTVT